MDWSSKDTNPVEDLRKVTKEIIEACQMCGGTTWLYKNLSSHPYVKVIKCSYCEGTGKLPQFRSRPFEHDSAMEIGLDGDV
jgi:hypothetical protein